MNDLILYLYLIDIVNSIDFVLKIAAVVSVVILASVAFYLISESWRLDGDDTKHIVNKYCKPVVVVLVITGLMLAVIPSKQTMYTVLGLYTANQVLQQPQMVGVGNQAMRILQAKLDEYEKELTQERPDDTEH